MNKNTLFSVQNGEKLISAPPSAISQTEFFSLETSKFGSCFNELNIIVNSADPRQIAPLERSDLGLHYLYFSSPPKS